MYPDPAITLNNNGGSTINGFNIMQGDGSECVNSSNSTVKILNCTTDYDIYISGGSASVSACELYSHQYGINTSSSATQDVNVINCLLDGQGWGMGINAGTGKLLVQNCLIRNFASEGIMAISPTWVKIDNNLIYGNAQTPTFWFNGGVYIYNPYSASELLDNMIYQNNCGMYFETSNTSVITLRNNTLANNYYGLYFPDSTSAGRTNVINSILWGNTIPIQNPTGASITYSCVQGGYSGTGNINPTSGPGYDSTYHLTSTSPCKDACGSFTPPTGEKDIDGDLRKVGTSVDMGADEFALEGNLSLRGFCAAWLSTPLSARWNPNYNYVSTPPSEIINFRDYAVFASHWAQPTGWTNPYVGVGMSPMSMDVNDSNGTIHTLGNPPPSSIYLTCDNTSPDPNTEVTVYVYSTVPLSSMQMYMSVSGDANITSAMSPADCNQYGWSPQYSGDPYIDDVNGIVGIYGGKWGTTDANTNVGYIKFIYNSGAVHVALTDDSNAYDANSQPVGYSTAPLVIGQPEQMIMQGGSQFAQSDTQPVVDVNEIVNWCQNLWDTDPGVQAMYSESDWQAFINSIRSGQ